MYYFIPNIVLISLLYLSALAPNIACIPLPTSTTPEAPKAFKVALSTFALSLTSTLNLVIHASTLTIFSAPPKASNTNGAFSTISLLAPPLAPYTSALVNNLVSSSSSSLPGVFKLNLMMMNLNNTK